MITVFIFYDDVCVGDFRSNSLEYIWDVVNTFLCKGKSWSFEIEMSDFEIEMSDEGE